MERMTSTIPIDPSFHIHADSIKIGHAFRADFQRQEPRAYYLIKIKLSAVIAPLPGLSDDLNSALINFLGLKTNWDC